MIEKSELIRLLRMLEERHSKTLHIKAYSLGDLIGAVIEGFEEADAFLEREVVPEPLPWEESPEDSSAK